MGDWLTVHVDGVPAPQGSKNAYRRGQRIVLVESSEKVGPWRDAVALAVRGAVARLPEAERERRIEPHVPLAVAAVFSMPPPKRLVRRYPTTKPDIDKLLRSTFDGITAGGGWRDDSQAVVVSAGMVYGPPFGAYLSITELSDDHVTVLAERAGARLNTRYKGEKE